MKGPSRKEELPQKFVARIEYDHKICRVKKISLPVASKPAAISTTFDEVKASCKARKRKERQESISSLCQERKVIRSNSEERPVPTKHGDTRTNMRRVSSSGDFPKSASLEKISVSPSRIQTSDKSLAYDDHEHEKRRSHERFARPHTIKNKSKQTSKRLRVRYGSKVKQKNELVNDKEHARKYASPCAQGPYQYTCVTANETSNEPEPEKLSATPINFKDLPDKDHHSPVHTPISPVLEFSTLHELVDCSEPVLSCTDRQVSENIETMPSLSIASNRSLLSPRNSIIATHKIYLDPDVPQMNVSLEKMPQSPIDGRIQKLNKLINSHKKKIKNYEAEFEVKHGFKPSQIDKMNDNTMRKLYTELNKLKKEQKQLTEMSASCSLMDFGGSCMKNGKPVSLRETVCEIEQKLSQKRETGNRCYSLDTMTADQLVNEKLAMQKSLLYLESVHGRPQSKEDRDTVRHFYDRYRMLKRMVSKLSNPAAGINELATIHENEAMHFVTPTSSSNDTESERTDNTKPIIVAISTSTDSDTESSFSENYHSLSKLELTEQLKLAIEEKKELRRAIKEFEMNLQTSSGKMLSKEDKIPMESVYASYKKVKAKIRLLEALIGKK